MQSALEIHVEKAFELLLSSIYAANPTVPSGSSQEPSPLSNVENELETWTLASQCLPIVQQKVSQKIRSLKRQRNATVPIGTLPPETLVEIYEVLIAKYVLGVRKTPAPLRMIFPLRCVCTTWHEVIDHTPRLWRKIRSSMPPDVMAMAVRNAGNLSLDVAHIIGERYWNPSPSDPQDSQRSSGYIKNLTPYLHRWRSATLAVWSQSRDTIPWLTGAAPLLESVMIGLSASTMDGEFGGPTFNLFNGDAPLLKDIHISGLNVLWNPAIFGALESLVIANCRYLPTAGQLCTMLQSSPSLRTFDISTPHLRDVSGPEVEAGPNIQLLQLQRILLDLPRHTLWLVLSVIKAPSCTVFVVKTAAARFSSLIHDSPVLNSISPYFASCLTEVSSPTIQIELTDNRFKLKVQNDPMDQRLFIFRLHTPEVFETVNWLGNQLPTIPMKLRISIETKHDIKIGSLVLERLPHVKYLSIQSAGGGAHSSGVGPKSMIRRLARQRRRSDGLLQWPFMELDVFEVQCARDDGRLVLRMLRRRYGVSKSFEGKDSEGLLPKPLISLVLNRSRHVGPGLRSRIEAVVEGGGGKVTWDTEPTADDGERDEVGSEDEDEDEADSEMDG